MEFNTAFVRQFFFISDVGKWIGEQWRDLGPAIVGLNPSDLRRISEKALDEVLDELAGLNFDVDQARALVAAAKEAWDQDGKNQCRNWGISRWRTAYRLLAGSTSASGDPDRRLICRFTWEREMKSLIAEGKHS